ETMLNSIREIRSGLRGLARAPVFALTVIATLGLGIGGTTAVFAVVHAVLIQPLPYPQPEGLVRISNHARGTNWVFSVADYQALEEQQTSFQDVAAIQSSLVTYTSQDVAERVFARFVTPSFFPLLGIRPTLGRALTQEDGEPSSPATALVSWGFWNRHLEGDPAAMGRTIRLNGQEYTVVGVLPRETGPFLNRQEIIGALQLEPPPRKGPFFLTVVGRLREGVARTAAEEELRVINDRIFPIWQASWPDQETTWAMRDLKEYVVGDVGASLLVVLGAAAFVLLMVCTNTTNLLLARLLDRRRELAVRTALGASRGRLLGHLFSESVVLALVGAGLGLLLTLWGVGLVSTLGTDFIPRANEVGFTTPVLGFFALITTGSLLLFGLLPSLRGGGSEVAQELREGGHGSSAGAGARRTRGLLVATQFAVSMPLLVGGGLLLATLAELRQVDPGFDADRVLTMSVSLPGDQSATTEELQDFWRVLLDRVRGLPGVETAGVGTGRPPSQFPFTNNFVLEDFPIGPGETQLSVPWVYASPEYFDALGTSLLAGRMYDRILDDSASVFLVDRAWATRFFGSPVEAVGRRFRSGGCTVDGCPWSTVVGVIEDVHYSGLGQPNEGVIFGNADQFPSRTTYLAVRAAESQDPSSFVPLVRGLVREAEPEAAITRIATGEDLLRADLMVPRYLATLVGSFGAISLLLSLIGIYGVMAYFVMQRRRDIGIRLALGGEPKQVAGLVLRSGMRLAAGGTVVGCVAALFLTRYMGSLLYGVEPTDPVVFGACIAGLGVIALLACWGPARRAARVPPREVLAEE
ncbi:MAG: ABC transporter permease, partial [Gemmatimonadetes bacterium]|nr:ABC transporter permease [Gemmatimonadota bacterium]